jgi:23S rRNA U2552 (ribose-2'-O)-methylase RlmE/FtsJ
LKLQGLRSLEALAHSTIDRRIRQRFERAKTLKLQSTRKGSSERYLIARGYRGDATAIR